MCVLWIATDRVKTKHIYGSVCVKIIKTIYKNIKNNSNEVRTLNQESVIFETKIRMCSEFPNDYYYQKMCIKTQKYDNREVKYEKSKFVGLLFAGDIVLVAESQRINYENVGNRTLSSN